METLATWGETWPHNPGKTEQDAIHATVYFVLDFERQERVNRKTNILSLCLRMPIQEILNTQYHRSVLPVEGSRFKGRWGRPEENKKTCPEIILGDLWKDNKQNIPQWWVGGGGCHKLLKCDETSVFVTPADGITSPITHCITTHLLAERIEKRTCHGQWELSLCSDI